MINLSLVQLFSVLGLVLGSGCSMGYRKVVHHGDIVRGDGRSLKVGGGSDSAHLMLNADFRFARISLPLELGSNEWDLEADDGGRVSDSALRERRFYRIDAPLISIFRPGEGLGIWYPGLLPQRKSLEFWIGVEFDAAKHGHRWADFGIMYYHYGRLGIRAYGGLGLEGVRATTRALNESALLWNDSAWGYGAGIEFTLTPGEYFLDFLKFLWKKDQRHQRRLKYRRYGN